LGEKVYTATEAGPLDSPAYPLQDRSKIIVDRSISTALVVDRSTSNASITQHCIDHQSSPSTASIIGQSIDDRSHCRQSVTIRLTDSSLPGFT
jgi:hypothetical protein